MLTQEAKQDLFRILDLYHTHTGKGVEIAHRFMSDLEDDLVDGGYYVPDQEDPTAYCGCFQHSALKALGLLNQIYEEERTHPDMLMTDIIDIVVSRHCSIPRTEFANAFSDFEVWLGSYEPWEYIHYTFDRERKVEDKAQLVKALNEWLDRN